MQLGLPVGMPKPLLNGHTIPRSRATWEKAHLISKKELSSFEGRKRFHTNLNIDPKLKMN